MVHSWNASSEAAELYDGGVTYNVQLLAYYAVLLLIVVASSAVRAARVRCCLHRRIGPGSTGFWSPLLSLTWGELMFLLAVVAAFVARYSVFLVSVRTWSAHLFSLHGVEAPAMRSLGPMNFLPSALPSFPRSVDLHGASPSAFHLSGRSSSTAGLGGPRLS